MFHFHFHMHLRHVTFQAFQEVEGKGINQNTEVTLEISTELVERTTGTR